MFLNGNCFIGTIPSTLFKCKELRVLSLWDNGFNGSVPSAIGNLTMLIALYLDQNNFEGMLSPVLVD
jgi:hypothetical protein